MRPRRWAVSSATIPRSCSSASTLLTVAALIPLALRGVPYRAVGAAAVAAHRAEERAVELDDLRLAGGPSQQADTSRVLLLKRNGTVVESRGDVVPDPGDELMVLPRAETKRVEVARGITQVLYQIAVVAKVALGL